jgi:succinate-semialdehyde dehydrogenase/glutarate-semialdehyde dehydrogenase
MASTFDVFDPATEESVGTVHNASPDDARRAVDRASAAQEHWSAAAPRVRAEALRAIFNTIIASQERLATLIVAENGKSLGDATSEVAYAAEFFRWFSEEAVRIEGSLGKAPNGDKRILVQNQPAGVAALVTPWNFPIAMATRKIAPALAAGCAVVLKPAAETPLSAIAVARLCADAGLPDGLVEVVATTDPEGVVGAILEHERVRVLSFTGSTEVGRLLLRQAADRVLNVSMELGGNAPFIVCDDASIEMAVDGAMIAKMRNGGAACTAANRFIVHDNVVDEFTERLAARMGALRVGPGSDEMNDVGPLINAQERDKVERLVRSTVEDGATAVVGGKPREGPGFFITPTVLRDVAERAAILDTEIFGPVAPIVSYRDEDHAIAMANRGPHGLVAYLYTDDLRRGLRLAERLEFGMVGLNRGLVSDPAAPFGGWKQSGIGREGGHVGIHEFMETKYIAVEW